MQSAPEGADFDEITQNKGQGAGQGHSMSPISVPIESSYTIPMSDYYELTSYRVPFPIAFDRSKIALSTPLAFNRLPPRRKGSPGTISVKCSVDVNGWLRYQVA